MHRLSVRPDQPNRRALAEAAKVISGGGIVAFPTETVYGLCIDATNADAVRRLYAVKGREATSACAFLLPDAGAVAVHVDEMPVIAQRIADRLWPGPVTLVVPGKEGRLVGLRLPRNELARALAAAAGRPLLQTSANRTGQPAALNGAGVRASLGDDVDLLLDAGRVPGGKSSTVVRCDGETFALLRPGAVPTPAIVRAATELTLVACTGNLCRSPLAEALLRREVAERLGCGEDKLVRHGFRFGSFGTMGLPGQPATDHSCTVGDEMGLDLSDHRSRSFSIALVRAARRVYCLSRNHLNFLQPYFAERPDDLMLLHPKERDIADPYGKPLKVYRKTAEQIQKAVEARAEELVPGDDESEEA